MSPFQFKTDDLSVSYDPENLSLTAASGGETWRTKPGSETYIVSRKFGTIPFASAKCEASAYKTGTVSGVKAVYTFEESGITAVTYVFAEGYDDTLHCEFFLKGDISSDVRAVYWPAPLEFNADDGCTVLPKMQGVLLPAKWDGKVPNFQNWQMLSRDFYMPFAGQVRNGSGCMMIFETPWDANCFVDHIPGGDTTLVPYWRPSLGHYSAHDKRKLSYRFPKNADYNLFAKIYRKYVCEHGDFVTLRQKAETNPNVSYMTGTPVYIDGICTMIHPDSEAYDKAHPERNTHVCRFETVGERLDMLKKEGFEKIYLHLDGWGKMGYDRLHPDVFPPCPEAGGAEGMKDLSDRCRELGYRFGIHDQFRDYYFEAETFDMDNVAVDEAGGYECYNVWCGGPQTFMCPELSPQYVRRNYATFDSLGIGIDGTYLDVFSVVDLDECFNEKHTVTRKDCVKYRRECYDFLNKKGIITSSEEAVDAVLPSFVLCHHAPFAVDELSSSTGKAVGIPIPLFTLVYHECLIVPWFGIDKKGGWHIPITDSGYLYALLTGGTVYVWPGMTKEERRRADIALALQAEVWDKELVSHEFIDGNTRRQRSTFAGGTTVTVDFETEEFSISHASN